MRFPWALALLVWVLLRPRRPRRHKGRTPANFAQTPTAGLRWHWNSQKHGWELLYRIPGAWRKGKGGLS